jgi:cell wall integrity and stress response component
MPQEAPNQTANFGRRRLSNGSLPDMITRNPNSLKVVNN